MKRSVVFFTLFLTAAACSSVRVLETQAESGFRVSDYKTFNFLEVEGAGDTSGSFDRNANLIKQSIAKELSTKGLSHTPSNADLLVNIGIVVEEKVQTRETNIREAPRYLGQRRYSWKSEEVEVGRYKEGTVTVHLVDAKTKKMVWQGVVEGTIPSKQEKLADRIDEGVDELFAQL